MLEKEINLHVIPKKSVKKLVNWRKELTNLATEAVDWLSFWIACVWISRSASPWPLVIL